MTAFDRLLAALSDRYTIERELGAGGMATVYLAHDIKHDRKVAVKVLREDLTASLGRRPAISPTLDAIIMRCLAKRPADRFQTAQELLMQLEPLATPSSGTTPTQTRPVAAVAGPKRTMRARFLLASMVVVALTGAPVVYLRRMPPVATLQQAVQLRRTAGVQEAPLISADGKGIAYRAFGPGDSVRHVEFRRGSDGSAVPVITDGSPLGWSSDGDGMLVATPRGLERVPTLGGVATLIVPRAVHGAWSPDGKRLAHVRGDSIVMRGGDAQPTLLVRTTEPHSLAWSPDGKWIAYVDGNARYLDDGNIAPAALWLAPTAGGAAGRLTTGDALNLSPSWAPDSRRLLFVSRRAGSGDIYQLDLDSHGRPRGDPFPLARGLNASQLSLSADGTHLAYSVASSQSHVRSVPMPSTGSVASSTATQLTTDRENIESIWISHDGKWLYFDSDRVGMQQIFRIPLVGGTVEQITHGTAPAFSVSTSPDGKNIGYHAIVDGKRRSYIQPIDGSGQPVQVSPGQFPDERNPIWSPDGRQVVWQVHDGPNWGVQAAALAPDGARTRGPVRTISSSGLVLLPTWVDSITLVGADTIQNRLLLVRTDSASTPSRALTPPLGYTLLFRRKANGSSLALAGNGTELITRVANQLWLIPIGGGPMRELVRFDDLHRIVSNARSYAEYGGRIYFAMKDTESNIWVVPVTGLAR